MRAEHSHFITLHVDWFNAERHPAFVAWADQRLGNGLASWCSAGESHGATEYPDIFLTVEPSLDGEGSDADMPETYWQKILDTLRDMQMAPKQHAIGVRLSPDA